MSHALDTEHRALHSPRMHHSCVSSFRLEIEESKKNQWATEKVLDQVSAV